ncbi:MAG: hypothetical protein ABI614_06210 [Planctomycetota bacterium]
MLSYFDYFPEKSKTELRTARFEEVSDDDPFPNGTYLFTEYFCTDPECDCQRVLVKVLRVAPEGTRPEEVATIGYTWCEHKDNVWKFVDAGLPNPLLDPFHPQARYAEDLMEFWHDMVQRDTAYAARLQRHYRELRSAHSRPSGRSGTSSRISTAKLPKARATTTLTKRERRERTRKLEQVKRLRKSR